MKPGRRYGLSSVVFFLHVIVHFWVVVFATTSAGTTETNSDEFQYKTLSQMWNALRGLVEAFPELARLEFVGNVSGATVYSLILSKQAHRRMFLMPRVRLASDFPAGSEILIHFASSLLFEYSKSEEVAKLLNTTEVHVLFWLHGYKIPEASNEECVKDDGTYHVQFLELDFDEASQGAVQPEARLLKRWFRSQRFLLGAALHAGNELSVNYGFSNKKDGAPVPAPDEDVLSEISSAYVDSNQAMRQSNKSCPRGRTSTPISRKHVSMTMQEYTYTSEGTLEILLSISCCIVPSNLSALWQENKESLLNSLLQADHGVRGYVKTTDGTLVAKALITIKGRNVAFWTSDQGEFFRILPPGDYVALVASKGYLPAKSSFRVPSQKWAEPVIVTLVEAYAPVNVKPAPQMALDPTTATEKDDPSPSGSKAGFLVVRRKFIVVIALLQLVVSMDYDY
ncbi:carboxypeptidase M-like [Ornithodoros turicata]|uniref:carboxypeptidase M-like n=1 Tax=Ornithodoros turicata TaxID=34597 RepID=UPI003139DECD